MTHSELHFYEDNIAAALSTIDKINLAALYVEYPHVIRELAEAVKAQNRIIARNRARMHARKLDGGNE